ncbi:hypothetical protein Tco_1382956 [Tanacetum coccineum]
MSEEDHHVDVGALPKFDMLLYASEMTTKDVKLMSLRHGIPLDLHPTFSGLKGWKKRVFFLDRGAIPDAMAWRHHDSDVNDLGGLATTWDFPSFRSIFKYTKGNEENKGCCKEKGEKREGGDGGEDSRPKTKRKKTVVLKDNLAASETTSSPRPIRTFDPNQTNPSDAAATTIES